LHSWGCRLTLVEARGIGLALYPLKKEEGNTMAKHEQVESITVKELIAILQERDEDELVVFTSDYGDRCHTQQVHPIRGFVREQYVSVSAYSDSGFKVADDDDETYEGDAEPQQVVVLS
jgi:hypothetical protein